MTPNVRLGLFAALGAYTMWGLLPLYFKLVGHYSADVILVHRVFWSLPTGIILVALAARWKEIRRALTPQRIGWLALSGALIGFNWLIYIWAVGQGRVMEASLGYYINPLVNVAIGAIFLSERLRKAQWVAVSLATVGVCVEAVALGQIPWVALLLCGTFASYSLIRKSVAIDSRAGFLVEVAVLFPVLALWVGSTGMMPRLEPDSTLDGFYLMLSGPITATPLILFALAAKRLRLSTIGFLQYLGPTLQFIIGVSFGEPLTLTRLAAFSLIWMAVAVFSVDGLRHEYRTRRGHLSVPRALTPKELAD